MPCGVEDVLAKSPIQYRGVVAYVLDCDIVVSEIRLKSDLPDHWRTLYSLDQWPS